MSSAVLRPLAVALELGIKEIAPLFSTRSSSWTVEIEDGGRQTGWHTWPSEEVRKWRKVQAEWKLNGHKLDERESISVALLARARPDAFEISVRVNDEYAFELERSYDSVPNGVQDLAGAVLELLLNHAEQVAARCSGEPRRG